MVDYLSELDRTGNSLMIYRDGEILFESNGNGIRPHLEAIDQHGRTLEGTVVVDKIVGRAAALLILYIGAREAYAAVISSGGRALFDSSGLPYSFSVEAEHIKMRDGRIYCPFESMVQGISDPDEAYRVILDKMAEFRG